MYFQYNQLNYDKIRSGLFTFIIFFKHLITAMLTLKDSLYHPAVMHLGRPVCSVRAIKSILLQWHLCVSVHVFPVLLTATSFSILR